MKYVQVSNFQVLVKINFEILISFFLGNLKWLPKTGISLIALELSEISSKFKQYFFGFDSANVGSDSL